MAINPDDFNNSETPRTRPAGLVIPGWMQTAGWVVAAVTATTLIYPHSFPSHCASDCDNPANVKKPWSVTIAEPQWMHDFLNPKKACDAPKTATVATASTDRLFPDPKQGTPTRMVKLRVPTETAKTVVKVNTPPRRQLKAAVKPKIQTQKPTQIPRQVVVKKSTGATVSQKVWTAPPPQLPKSPSKVVVPQTPVPPIDGFRQNSQTMCVPCQQQNQQYSQPVIRQGVGSAVIPAATILLLDHTRLGNRLHVTATGGSRTSGADFLYDGLTTADGSDGFLSTVSVLTANRLAAQGLQVSSQYTPESAILIGRAQSAARIAAMVTAAWQSSYESQVAFRALQNNSHFSGSAAAFLRSAQSNPKSVYNGAATRAAFDAVYSNAALLSVIDSATLRQVQSFGNIGSQRVSNDLLRLAGNIGLTECKGEFSFLPRVNLLSAKYTDMSRTTENALATLQYHQAPAVVQPQSRPQPQIQQQSNTPIVPPTNLPPIQEQPSRNGTLVPKSNYGM